MTRKELKNIIDECITATTDALTEDELDEIGDSLADRLEEEGVDIEDDDVEDDADSEEE